MNLGPTNPATKQIHEYALLLLNISLWQWIDLLEKSKRSILINGPNQHDCDAEKMARDRIADLNISIKALSA